MAAVSQQQKQQQQLKKEQQETTMASPSSISISISPADAARDPLAAVRALHSAARSSSSSPAEDGDWGVTELFRAVAEDEELAKTIPTLTSSNVDSIPQHALVRYRGMVQDTLDPEYYLGAYLQGGSGTGSDEWATTKFADAVPPAAAAAAAAAAEEAAGGGGGASKIPCCAHAAAAAAAAAAAVRPPPAAAVWERRPLYCVSVPGERQRGEEEQKAATTATAVAPSPSAPAPASSAKRAREGNDDDGDVAMEAAATTAAETGEKKKKEAAPEEKKEEEKKKNKKEADDSNKPPPPAPLPPRAGDAMVFFYPSGPSNSFPSPRLNDVVEVWGVLSRVPELAAAHLESKGGKDNNNNASSSSSSASTSSLSSSSWAEAAELAARPPTSEVPRVHALFVRKCEAHPRLASVAKEHGFVKSSSEAAAAAALVPSPLPAPPSAAAAAAAAARAAALAALRRSLRGDALAAEYLLLQLVSRVHLRTAGLALGTLALDITGCPPGIGESGKKSPPSPSASASASPLNLSDFGASVAATLSLLSPRSVSLPLSLDALNSLRLRPGRCPLSGRLAQAPLQLAPGTQVLLDETALGPGALTPLGRDSVDALRGLVAEKAVEYDFGYCRGAMPADAAVTILSSGKSGSVLRAHVDVSVPLQPEEIEEEAGMMEEEGGGTTTASTTASSLVEAAAALFDAMRTAEFSFGEEEEEEEEEEEGEEDAMDSDDAEKKKKKEKEKKEKKKKKESGRAPKWLEEKLLEARRRGTTTAAAATTTNNNNANSSSSHSSSSSSPPASSEADLHLALTLARLYALSHGETTLRPRHWEGAQRMEAERRGRLAVAGVRAAYTG